MFVTVRTEKPDFLEKPNDQEITEGDDGLFQVVVTGRPEPTINWSIFNFDTLILSYELQTSIWCHRNIVFSSPDSQF